MIPLDSPRYPVTNSTPSFGDGVAAFRITDYLSIGAVTAFGAAYGYGIATPRGVRTPSMWLATVVGFSGATCAALISSQSRLMGYSPHNFTEDGHVKKPLLEASAESQEYLSSYAARAPPS